jgi:DNA-binding response OmpR family regulator
MIMTLSIAIFLISLYLRDKRRQMDDEKMKFLINATHDIRSPLTLIMSPLAKLKQRHGSPEDQEELGLIEHNTQRILGLVNQILDVRKIDKKQMHLTFQQTNLTEYVNGIFKMYCYNATERNITYTFVCPETSVVAWIDHNQFDKVISNLISNAFKYTFDGGHIEVTLKTTDDNFVQLSVRDDGIGIKEEDRERIFERFYQSQQSESSHVTGTGIGLNLCKMIVELHHGQIEAFSRKEGKGSEFVVRIPMGKEHLQPDELLSNQHTPIAAERPNTPYKLLFVDDDTELCSFIRKELGHYFHIDSCHNGREAIRMLMNNDYHLVISDVMMPEMDGFSLLRLIKKNPELNHIPVILLTSKADIANRMEGLERGADAFMAKPFNIQELHVLVNSLISNVLRLKGKFTGAQQQNGRLETKEIKSNDEVLMERVMKAISMNLDDNDFGVEDLAKEVGLSRTHLQRKMKEQTGLNVAEFIRNIRLEQAARLLREQKLNVSQVAYSVGFSNLAHFSTVFKKHFGLTPTEYITKIERGE